MKKTYAYHKPSAKCRLEAVLLKLPTLVGQLIEYLKQIRASMAELPDIDRAIALLVVIHETTAMWAIKAVVCNDPESEVTT